MPGSMKRKSEEDTWLVSQSKKSRSNPLSDSVFASTLAKLRIGTRKFFRSPEKDDINAENDNHNQDALYSPGQSVNNRNDRVVPQNEIKICSDCRMAGNRRIAPDRKCSFCELTFCHLNRCKSCDDQFCENCSIQRYDDSSEAFICFHCLS